MSFQARITKRYYSHLQSLDMIFKGHFLSIALVRTSFRTNNITCLWNRCAQKWKKIMGEKNLFMRVKMNFEGFIWVIKNHEPVLLPWFQYFVSLSEHPSASYLPRSIVRATNAPQMTLKQNPIQCAKLR